MELARFFRVESVPFVLRLPSRSTGRQSCIRERAAPCVISLRMKSSQIIAVLTTSETLLPLKAKRVWTGGFADSNGDNVIPQRSMQKFKFRLRVEVASLRELLRRVSH